MELLSTIKKSRCKEAQIVAYCDAEVKGTENNETVTIEEFKKMWMQAGSSVFFDPRMRGDILGQLLDGLVIQEKPERWTDF